MRLLVCGGRDYRDRDLVYLTLDAAVQYGGCTEIICGYDPDDKRYQGADQLAYEWAQEAEFSCRHFPADWANKRRSAGPIRNSIMAAQKPDECIAFPRANGEWGPGTLDMIGKAAKAGARVERVWRLFPAESPASSPSEASAGNLPPDEPNPSPNTPQRTDSVTNLNHKEQS